VRAIQVEQFGGPEALVLVEVADPRPGPGELLIEVTGAGVNFADTHQVEDSYLSPTTLPFIPGSEVIGIEVASGRRMAGLVSSGGGYAERALIAESFSFEVPTSVTDTQALALLVQGLTAWHLLTTSTRLQPGESLVVHAAAGGVGNLAVQLGRHLGAGLIIPTASTPEKIATARELGADEGVVIGADDDADTIAAALRAAAGGGVDVILEMVGGATFDGSLRSLAQFGRLATYGMASRTAPRSVQPGQLMVGSYSLIGFWLMDCIGADRAQQMVVEPLAQLVHLVADGVLRPLAGGIYALEDARTAHMDMRARRTTGKVVLDPRLLPGSTT
jgi:NADPH2:quinone reductase